MRIHGFGVQRVELRGLDRPSRSANLRCGGLKRARRATGEVDTLAPSRAKAVAIARPIELAPPCELLGAARVAFTDGLEVAVLVGAGVGAAMAVLAAFELRSARLESE